MKKLMIAASAAIAMTAGIVAAEIAPRPTPWGYYPEPTDCWTPAPRPRRPVFPPRPRPPHPPFDIRVQPKEVALYVFAPESTTQTVWKVEQSADLATWEPLTNVVNGVKCFFRVTPVAAEIAE